MILVSIKGKSYACGSIITTNCLLLLSLRTKLFWMSLLFISMVSGTGLFSLSNQEAYALDEEFVGDNSQYDEGCTNFVEVDCGAGTTDGETTTSGSQDTGGVSFIDEDGDDVEDAYDPCIDPNDQFNNCSVNTDGDSFPNQQDPCPDDHLTQCFKTQGL